MAGARTTVISYGTWDSNDTSWHLNGVHSYEQDERRFSCSFDVVYRNATMATLESDIAAAEAVWNSRHQDFKIVVESRTLFHFVDGTGSVGASEEGAEFIQCDWRLLGSHRTANSRAYRLTVTVLRAANQSGKPGILDQSIRVSTSPSGIRRMSYRATFTTGPSSSETGNADDRYGDGTYGFDALVSAIQTTLTGDWEQSSPVVKTYDEDKRSLSASAAYQELIYAQSSAATDDTDLFGVRYDVKVDRSAAFSIPGQLNVQPFTAVSVSFSSSVLKTANLSTVIDSKVIPYVKATVSRVLRTGAGSLVMLRHGLRADPVTHRISGQVLFLVEETTTLELSKRTVETYRSGDVYVPVLDGTKWTRDKHTGPGSWVRRVTFAIRVVGEDADLQLDVLEAQERIDQLGEGFEVIGYGSTLSPSVEVFREDNASITTTVVAREQIFVRADVRYTTAPSASTGSSGSSGPGGSVYRKR